MKIKRWKVFIWVEKLVKLILSYELFVHICIGYELHATHRWTRCFQIFVILHWGGKKLKLQVKFLLPKAILLHPSASLSPHRCNPGYIRACNALAATSLKVLVSHKCRSLVVQLLYHRPARSENIPQSIISALLWVKMFPTALQTTMGRNGAVCDA